MPLFGSFALETKCKTSESIFLQLIVIYPHHDNHPKNVQANPPHQMRTCETYLAKDPQIYPITDPAEPFNATP